MGDAAASPHKLGRVRRSGGALEAAAGSPAEVGLTDDGRGYSIVDQIFVESQAMSRYALASGLKLPVSAIQILAELSDGDVSTEIKPSMAPSASQSLPERNAKIRRLVQAHDQLALIVSPATPRTLLLLERERVSSNHWRFLGPVRLVRMMMLAAVVFLTTFLATALSPEVNAGSGDIFRSHGHVLLINEVFLLSAAAVGAAFAALFQANRYVAEGTYDPKYEASYWVRFVLGLIAGIVLSSLVPIDKGNTLSRPLLALLGGFSANLVYELLARLVEAVESLANGDAKAILSAKEQLVRTKAAEELGQSRLRLGGMLLSLREQVRVGTAPAELDRSLSAILEEIVPAAEEVATDPGVPSEPA